MNKLSNRPAAIAGIAGLGILAGYIYSRPKADTTQPAQVSAPTKTKQAKIKRDLGMSGAGIGGNVSSGSTELEDPENPGQLITRKASSANPPPEGAGSNNTVNPPIQTEQSSFGSRLFAKSSGDRSSLEGHRDTRVASNLTETPTKRSE